MCALDQAGKDGLLSADGRHYRRCANHAEYGNCNWLVGEDDPNPLCPSCRLNKVIPSLDRPDNLKLWARLEQAKRRLVYSLHSLGLPLGQSEGRPGLAFRFLEDRRRNPEVQEQFVPTAHEDGVITINIAEADDAVRHAVREQMQERYRTVLGHLRHECGHYYFNVLVSTPEALAECRELFGDERTGYANALERHYASGPPERWPERYISAYASAHPSEDFAETFAHYLHITDALETARTAGLWRTGGPASGSPDWIEDWVCLAISLNEILRSLGVDDPYPFVITQIVREKLLFIDRLVRPPT